MEEPLTYRGSNGPPADGGAGNAGDVAGDDVSCDVDGARVPVGGTGAANCEVGSDGDGVNREVGGDGDAVA